MKEIIKLQEELNQKEKELAEKYNVKAIDINPHRIHAGTELGHMSFWYNENIDKLKVKKICNGEQPETVEEFKALQKQFKTEEVLLSIVAKDFKGMMDEREADES